jgi:homoserine O-acetyltransferase
VIGIDSDRLFPVEGQQIIAAHLRHNIDGPEAVVLHSSYGHDGFLIENEAVSAQLARILT